MTRLRALAACLAAGWIATTLAATVSLTVSGVTTKRIVWITVGVSVSAVGGYVIGRTRPGHCLLAWAEDRFYGPHGPGWWIAQVIGVAAIAWMLVAHPRRSAANRRPWRDARAAPRSPAPALDPEWATHRRENQP